MGARAKKLQELEVGQLYLSLSHVSYKDFVTPCYNVVEIVPIPEGWAAHPQDNIRYARFVDPLNTKKPRKCSSGLFVIWAWEIDRLKDDATAYYHILDYDTP